jgi:hypothetical protein
MDIHLCFCVRLKQINSSKELICAGKCEFQPIKSLEITLTITFTINLRLTTFCGNRPLVFISVLSANCVFQSSHTPHRRPFRKCSTPQRRNNVPIYQAVTGKTCDSTTLKSLKTCRTKYNYWTSYM